MTNIVDRRRQRKSQSPEFPTGFAREAQKYVNFGLKVFPLKPGEKKPLGGHGHKEATTNPAKILEWWSNHPNANIGLAMGEVVVVDIDGADGLRFLENEFSVSNPLELSPTPLIQKTPNGYHLLYKRNGMIIRNDAKDIAAGIDTRGTHPDGTPAGYIVASPSINETGKPYRWLNFDAFTKLDQIPEMPRRLAYSATFSRKQREYIEATPKLKARIEAVTPQEWRRIWDEFSPARVRSESGSSRVPFEHPYVQATIDSICDEIAALTPGQQQEGFAKTGCFALGNFLQSCGLTDQGTVDKVIDRAVEAGLQMDNKRGHQLGDWKEEQLRKIAERCVLEGIERGSRPPPVLDKAQFQNANGSSAYDLPREVSEPSDSRSASEFGVAVKEWGEEEIGQLLSRMNRDHALVSLGSSVRYVHVTANGEHGSAKLDFLRAEDMRRLYANVHVPHGRRKNGFDFWDQWPGRRQYRGVGLFPSGHGAPPVPDGYLNLWRGFAVEPKKGDWKFFHDHLRDVVCGGNEVHFNWFMDWLAHLFQRPYEKLGVAVVLKSRAKGTGKSMVLGFLRRLLGSHAMSVSHASHITGNFNGHLSETILLGAEEAFWAGSASAQGVIKDLITNDYLAIERKGVDAVSQRNYLRLIITSNEAWSVPADIDERRFFVLEVDNLRAKDRTYFEPIFEQMEAGGLEAMLFDFLNREIKSDLRNPPETSALVKEREQSLDGPARFLLDIARDGFIEVDNRKYDGAGSDRQALFNDDEPTEFRADAVRDAATKYKGRYEDRAFAKRLGELLARVGVVKPRTRDNGRRLYVYRFPPLPVFRKAVENELRVPVAGSEEASEFDYFDRWYRNGDRS